MFMYYFLNLLYTHQHCWHFWQATHLCFWTVGGKLE